jgi:hypothetical protein
VDRARSAGRIREALPHFQRGVQLWPCQTHGQHIARVSSTRQTPGKLQKNPGEKKTPEKTVEKNSKVALLRPKPGRYFRAVGVWTPHAVRSLGMHRACSQGNDLTNGLRWEHSCGWAPGLRARSARLGLTACQPAASTPPLLAPAVPALPTAPLTAPPPVTPACPSCFLGCYPRRLIIGLVFCVLGCEGQEIQVDSVSATASVGCSARSLTAEPPVNVLIAGSIDTSGRFIAPTDLTIILESYGTLRSGIGRTFRVGTRWVNRGQSGGGLWCETHAACTPATAGWVRLERQEADSTLIGEFRLTFSESRVLRGRFEAEWHRYWQLC